MNTETGTKQAEKTAKMKKDNLVQPQNELVKLSDLPDYITAQFDIITSLQKRVNALNRDFEIEMKCKKQAYKFILTKGHFSDFQKFSKENL